MYETESTVGSLKGLIQHMPTVACVSIFWWSMHQNKLTSWANTCIYNICPYRKNLPLCSSEKQSYSCSRNTTHQVTAMLLLTPATGLSEKAESTDF